MRHFSKSGAMGLAAAVILSLVLHPGAAGAATSRTLSLHASPSAALAGHQVTVSGVLSKSPKGSSVRIQRYSGSTWKTTKSTVTTSSTGKYSTTVTLPSTPKAYKYRALALATHTLATAKSATVTVTALRKTRFHQVSNNDFIMLSAHQGEPSAATGSLQSPYTSGAKVVVQRRPSSASAWVTLGTSTIQSSGIFNIPFNNAQSGEFRVVVSRKGLNSSAYSKTESFVFTP